MWRYDELDAFSEGKDYKDDYLNINVYLRFP